MQCANPNTAMEAPNHGIGYRMTLLVYAYTTQAKAIRDSARNAADFQDPTYSEANPLMLLLRARAGEQQGGQCTYSQRRNCTKPPQKLNDPDHRNIPLGY